ncbi:MAG: 50S ribosomal protein L22 [Puniceicoccales bacterium]|nr:50S ribosomal protein L22 [Puniceicoccales bacterium]
MTVQSLSRYVRMSPLKLRLLTRGLVGLPAERVLQMLRLVPRRSARLLAKTLKSALANAENNRNLSADRLVLSQAIVNEGPRLKRFVPAARGSAHPIRKRTSHIKMVLT